MVGCEADLSEVEQMLAALEAGASLLELTELDVSGLSTEVVDAEVVE